MRKILLLLVGIAVLWVPAVSVAGDSSPKPSKLTRAETPDPKSGVSNPANTCQAQRGGPRAAKAFGKCVAAIAKHKDKNQGADHGKESAERQNKDSAKGQTEDNAKSQGTASASRARTCRAMQANDHTAFQTTYGTRPNAFGKCVANHANSKKNS
jgi:hypothetical protein